MRISSMNMEKKEYITQKTWGFFFYFTKINKTKIPDWWSGNYDEDHNKYNPADTGEYGSTIPLEVIEHLKKCRERKTCELLLGASTHLSVQIIERKIFWKISNTDGGIFYELPRHWRQIPLRLPWRLHKIELHNDYFPYNLQSHF